MVMRHFIAGCIFLFSLFLTACSSNRDLLFTHNLANETWMREVETDPLVWTRGTDPWFLSGDAHATETPDCYKGPVSTMQVNASDFSGIKTNGDFKVQIFGTQAANTVYIYGPAEAVSAISAVVKGDTLYLNQHKKASAYLMRQVIIRIGVHRLTNLVQYGRGMIEGIRLGADSLSITSIGSGNIYLAGRMNLKQVQNFGPASINIFGANTPELDVRTSGSGATNISGNIGVRSIVHHGSSCINIIGANSNHLGIIADGRGKIGVSGAVSLCLLKAKDTVRVYVCGIHTPALHVYTDDYARVGLAGVARNFYVDASEDTFVAARNLCTDEAYIHANDRAHVNVSAARKIFAAASGSGSVYFFGPADILTRFVSGSGLVMHMCAEEGSCAVKPKMQTQFVGAG